MCVHVGLSRSIGEMFRAVSGTDKVPGVLDANAATAMMCLIAHFLAPSFIAFFFSERGR